MAENDLKNKLQELDESLRSRYVKTILSLDLDELSKVKTNKSTYKSKIKSEILELLPEVGDRQADETAQYISNLLSNEAQREKTRRLTKTDKPQNESRNRITSQSQTILRVTNKQKRLRYASQVRTHNNTDFRTQSYGSWTAQCTIIMTR